MPAFAYRYVGREELPARLTEFDLRQFFRLTSADIAAIRERFRADRYAAVGLQLVCLRAFGRPLDRFAAVPRNLLRYLRRARHGTATCPNKILPGKVPGLHV